MRELLQNQQQVVVSKAEMTTAELLQKVQRLESMLSLAAKEAAKGCCPYDVAGAAAVRDFCDETCGDNEQKSRECWIEYWELVSNDA